MKIVYISHPISGDVDGNIKDILRIIRKINIEFKYVHPVASYVVDCLSLDDNNPLERLRGMKNNENLIKSCVFDEIWLTGERISGGMRVEINLFVLQQKPIINYINKF